MLPLDRCYVLENPWLYPHCCYSLLLWFDISLWYAMMIYGEQGGSVTVFMR